MFESFLIYINKCGWNLRSKRTLLTVSGGIDSMVLADLFYRAGLEAGVAHCNFRLRGDDSDLDEVLVMNKAGAYEFPFYSTSFETREVATESRVSTQMAARQLRYNWFETLAATCHYDYIATAHHVNDHVETVLLNLVRGTGLKGLRGIPGTNGKVIRPLLFATRREIEAYAAQRGITWREDASNRSDYYKRNLIRHQVIPVLQKINPSLESAVIQMTDKLTAAETLLEAHLDEWGTQALRVEGDTHYIAIDRLRASKMPAYVLHHLLDPYGFSYVQCKEMARALDEISGKQFYSETHYLVKDREELVLAPLKRASGSILPATGLEVHLDLFPMTSEMTFPTDQSEAWFDAEKLLLPLTVRWWQPGDWFCPLGMDGKRKKVSDLLIDLKINRIAKEAVRVLVDREGTIVWVIGLRNDHRARVTDQTARVARVRYTAVSRSQITPLKS